MAEDQVNLSYLLNRRLGKADINHLATLVHGTTNNPRKAMLYALLDDPDTRIATNVLWVFCHLDPTDNEWLCSRRDDLTDRVMREPVSGKRRLLLSILYQLPTDAANTRTDFLDFCLEHLSLSTEAAACRALCIKLAYRLCRPYKELCHELELTLQDLSYQSLPPAVEATRRNTLKVLARHARLG